MGVETGDAAGLPVADFNQFVRVAVAAAEGVYDAVQILRGGIIYRVGVAHGHGGFLFQEGCTGGVVGLPGAVEEVFDVPERFPERLAAVGADLAPEVRGGQHPGFAARCIQRLPDNQRIVVQHAGAGHGHIADFIEVGRGMLIGTVAPAVPAAVVALVQGDAEVVQEVGRPGAGAVGDACLRDDGVAFRDGLLHEQLPVDGGPAFAGHDL